MLPVDQIHSTLLSSAACYLLILFYFRNREQQTFSRFRAWGFGLIVFGLVLATKISYDFKLEAKVANYYEVLEVGRQGSTIDIRKAYKKMSKIYHPDKSTGSDTADRFQKIKTAYDVLMDETQRDIYNRFGERDLTFDPRKDEIKLICDIGVTYVFWVVVAYVLTLPAAARVSRTWIGILGIFLLSLEVFFSLTETSMPSWMQPSSLTEHELVSVMHSVFPVAMAALRFLAECLYVDVDETSLSVLRNLVDHQTAVRDILAEIDATLEPSQLKDQKERRQEARTKLLDLKEKIDNSNAVTAQRILMLKNASSNPGSSYYWILFVLLYGGVYLLQ